jgi:uncharacterized protein YigA (DUF484 family)
MFCRIFPAQMFLEKRRILHDFLQDNPAFLQENPALWQENPAFLQENPAFLQENPAFLQENPAFLSENPAFLQENPAFLQENPAFLSESPAFLQENPAFLPKHLSKFCTFSRIFLWMIWENLELWKIVLQNLSFRSDPLDPNPNLLNVIGGFCLEKTVQ